MTATPAPTPQPAAPGPQAGPVATAPTSRGRSGGASPAAAPFGGADTAAARCVRCTAPVHEGTGRQRMQGPDFEVAHARVADCAPLATTTRRDVTCDRCRRRVPAGEGVSTGACEGDGPVTWSTIHADGCPPAPPTPPGTSSGAVPTNSRPAVCAMCCQTVEPGQGRLWCRTGEEPIAVHADPCTPWPGQPVTRIVRRTSGIGDGLLEWSPGAAVRWAVRPGGDLPAGLPGREDSAGAIGGIWVVLGTHRIVTRCESTEGGPGVTDTAVLRPATPAEAGPVLDEEAVQRWSRRAGGDFSYLRRLGAVSRQRAADPARTPAASSRWAAPPPAMLALLVALVVAR